MPTWFPPVASTVLALIPVIIWLRIIHREGEEKSLYIKTFLIGTMSVIPPFILMFLFAKYPHLNIYKLIQRTVEQAAFASLLSNLIVAVVEEIAKNVIVRVIDKRHPEYIQTIGAALKLSICAGLGFSFAENIWYFYGITIDPQFSMAELFSTFVFRSIFTMCGHMVFSGIFGYYFGLGKFAADLTEMGRLQGKGFWIARFISKLTGKMTFQIVREQKNLMGLFLAMFIHISFNVSLDMGRKLLPILIIALSALYVAHLRQTKSGRFLLSVIKRRNSTMAPQDQDVVMELLGMWLKEGKLEEVMQICDRLLMRDPDNNVVKMFRAKAADNQQLKHFFTNLKQIFEKNKEIPEQAASNAFSKMSAEDEKVAIEVMNTWYKEGKEKDALAVAKRLIERNPKSEGARVLMQKIMTQEKMQRVFDSLSKLFTE